MPMNKLFTLVLVLGTATLLILASVHYGACSQPFGPPMGPPSPGMRPGPPSPGMRPAPPPMGLVPGQQPFFMGPCVPFQPCRSFSLEGGGRGFYTGNSFRIIRKSGADIDFVRDLNFSQNTLVAEVYAALRVAPTLALTFSYMIPRDDNGHGTLPETLTLGNTIFPALTQVTSKSSTSLYRLEGEYFLAVGYNYRVGGLLLGEIWVENLRMESLLAKDSQSFEEFLMGAGGSGEYAPANGIFVKVKGAYTFLQKQNGFFLDCQGKFFPELAAGYGSQMRPYVAGGYRFRTSEWVVNEDKKIQATIQGPYVELGLIF